jgi:N6-adenosine-specific RNA methylase IME4
MKFDCIILDPPWQYDNKNTGGSLISGADKKYPTLSFNKLLWLSEPIQNVSKKDCVIYLWVTNSMLQEGLELLESYGFEYKTLITWVKQNGKGMGFWYRGNTEHMILGIKGNIKAFHSQQINVFHSLTREHSQKPIKAYELIEEGTKSIKDCKTLEIFARRQYKDWTCIGYDLDGIDVFDSLEIVAKK